MLTLAAPRLTDGLVTGSEFDLNVAAGAGGALHASNVNFSVVVVDTGFDRNKAAGKRPESNYKHYS